MGNQREKRNWEQSKKWLPYIGDGNKSIKGIPPKKKWYVWVNMPKKLSKIRRKVLWIRTKSHRWKYKDVWSKGSDNQWVK